jgi:uncharacterized protein YecT (DUF1311 family)
MTARSICSWLVLFVFLEIASQANDPKDPTHAEAKAAYDKADAALNAAWAEVKKALAPEEFAALTADQKAWLELRDHLALAPNYSGAPANKAEARHSPEYFTSAASLMEDRANWLRGLLSDGYGDSLTGHWEDSRGGSLDIVERDGKIHFIIETVRGRATDLGALAGIATWNDPLGWFSDKGRDKSKNDETNLAFVWRGRKLEIIGANTEYYHGKSAWFDGGYVKFMPLGKKESARVLKAAKTGEIPEE